MPHINDIDALAHRPADAPILDIFRKRWSPRAMSGEPISDGQLMQLLEAARWAPSSFNEQPWRVLYAKRDTPMWTTFFSLLMEANQAWCDRGAALLLFASKKTFTKNGQPNKVHTFDCGSAWQNLALQGAHMGLVVHGMAGFNNSRARVELGIPEDFDAEAMAVVGRPGRVEDLPDSLRQKELPPSPRKPVKEWAREGKFAF